MITSEPEELPRPELAVVEHVFRSGSFILGTEVRQFEEVWANFCDMKFCVGIANEMESIELGLRALSIGNGVRGNAVAQLVLRLFATECHLKKCSMGLSNDNRHLG